MTRSIRRPEWRRAHEQANHYQHVDSTVDQDTVHLVWRTVQVPNEPRLWTTWLWATKEAILRELGRPT